MALLQFLSAGSHELLPWLQLVMNCDLGIEMKQTLSFPRLLLVSVLSHVMAVLGYQLDYIWIN